MIKLLVKYICLVTFVIGLSGCASNNASMEENSAPMLERYNRAMFSFNDKLDKNVFRPVAKGYRAITNEFTRQRVTNFFNNIMEPVSATNHLLQGEVENSGVDLSRFVLNTVLGGAGLFDVASKAGLERNPTGFDETMATWCVPDGDFIILPVFGPSTPRAATGFVVDGYTSPAFIIASRSGSDDAAWYYMGAMGLKYLNLMAENIKLLESLEEGSIDYYETVKSAYLQNRGKIKRCGGSTGETLPEYDFDMDEED